MASKRGQQRKARTLSERAIYEKGKAARKARLLSEKAKERRRP